MNRLFCNVVPRKCSISGNAVVECHSQGKYECKIKGKNKIVTILISND